MPTKASPKVLAAGGAGGAAGDGDSEGGAVTELMYFLPLNFLPLVWKVRGLHGSFPDCGTGAGLL